MGFWARNKRLIIGLLIAAAAFAVLRPVLFGGEGRRFRYPAVVWPWRSTYNQLEAKAKSYEEKLRRYYDPAGRSAQEVIAELQQQNQHLKETGEAIRHTMVFMPHPPFVLNPDDALPGVTFKNVLTRTRMDVGQYLSAREIQGDYNLGFDPGGLVPDPLQVPLMLRQLQAIEKLCILAADAQVMAILEVKPFAPHTEGPESREHLLQVTPIRIRMRTTIDSLARFLASLYGKHGEVTDVRGTGENQILTVNFGENHGVRQNQVFAVFRPTTLSYVGMVQVAWVGKDTARARKASFPEGTYDPAPQLQVQPGDRVTSGFFSLLDLRFNGVPPNIERDRDGVLKRAEPAYLDTSVIVGFIEFPVEDAAATFPAPPPTRPTPAGPVVPRY